MTERLNFVPSPGAQTSSAPRVASSQMGDGYEENKADGLNTDLKDYTLQFVIPQESTKYFNDFLNRHRGYIAFYMLSPSRHTWVLVKCPKWSETTHHHYSTFNLTVSEVML